MVEKIGIFLLVVAFVYSIGMRFVYKQALEEAEVKLRHKDKKIEELRKDLDFFMEKMSK